MNVREYNENKKNTMRCLQDMNAFMNSLQNQDFG